MGLDVEFSGPALRDLDSRLAYYTRESGGAVALDFVDAVERASLLLADMPEMGAVRSFENPFYDGCRFWPLKEFAGVLLWYRVFDDRIEIVRIVHSAQDYRRVMED